MEITKSSGNLEDRGNNLISQILGFGSIDFSVGLNVKLNCKIVFLKLNQNYYSPS